MNANEFINNISEIDRILKLGHINIKNKDKIFSMRNDFEYQKDDNWQKINDFKNGCWNFLINWNNFVYDLRSGYDTRFYTLNNIICHYK